MLPILAYVSIVAIVFTFGMFPFMYLYTKSIYFDRKVYERLIKYILIGLFIPVINEVIFTSLIILIILLLTYPKIARNINSFVLYF